MAAYEAEENRGAFEPDYSPAGPDSNDWPGWWIQSEPNPLSAFYFSLEELADWEQYANSLELHERSHTGGVYFFGEDANLPPEQGPDYIGPW